MMTAIHGKARALGPEFRAAERGGWFRLLLVLGLGLALGSVSGAQAQAKPSDTDAKCLACHSMPGLSKRLEDGDTLSLTVARDAYATSVHAMFGCVACHSDVNPSQHPAMRSVATAHAYAVEKSSECRKCHAGTFERYEESIHASLVAAGDPAAPLCSTCHDPHAIQKGAAPGAESGEPCKTCHEDVFDAYAGSVHGQARMGAGKAHAPICMDCHQAHDVTAIAGGERLKAACLGCHANAEADHDAWLPNSALHLKSVSCPACHSPMAERAVDLMLYDKDSQELLAESLENPRFLAQVEAIDTAGDGLDPLELWTLLSELEQQGSVPGLALRGRMGVPSGPEAHRLAVKLEAVRSCETCHQQGADPFQNVTISIGGADGRRVKAAAGKETLTSAASVDSVSGFYNAGGTRIGLLDVLLVLAIAAGLGIPLIHMAARRYFDKRD